MADRLRLRHLWLLVPFWGLAVRAGVPLRDNSFMWHVRAGIDQLAAGEVIRTDPYSFSRFGAPWRTQSWLIELGYGRLEAWFPGLTWEPWFLLVVVGSALAIVLAVLWSRLGAHAGVIVVLLAVGWLAQPYAQPRPVAISFVLFALVAGIIAAKRPPLWAVPPLFWLWAAVHGSFIVGMGFLVLDAVRRRSGRQAVAVGIGAVAASFTAHGIGVWQILVEFARNRDGLALIQEWRPPDFTTPWLAAFLVLLAILMVGLSAGRIPPAAMWVVVPAVVFGLTSARSVLPAVLLLTPWLGDAAGTIPNPRESESSRIAVWATAAALVGSGLFAVAQPLEIDATLFPGPDAISSLGDANLFTTASAAGYLIYADPGRRVLVDDRVELYGVDLLQRYEAAAMGVDWRALFGDYDIGQVLVGAASPLSDALTDAGWSECYLDEHFVVLAPTCL